MSFLRGFFKRAVTDYAAATPPPRSLPATGWSVVDVETTGLYPTDRIVEIAIVRLDPHGGEVGAWSTLVDPGRAVTATNVHGIHARDVVGAPRFDQIAGEVFLRIADSIVVAHNAPFDVRFLRAEAERAQLPWDLPGAACTMTLLGRAGMVHGRSLVACCEQLGVPLTDNHTALADARATAALLRHLIRHRTWGQLMEPWPPAPSWPGPRFVGAVRSRSVGPSYARGHLGALAAQVQVPDIPGLHPDAATAYFALLDAVLEDRRIDDKEMQGMLALAAEWGLSSADLRMLHVAYLSGMWEVARADGVVTDEELRDIEVLGSALGVSASAGVSQEEARRAGARDDCVARGRALIADQAALDGLSVVFTGDSVCLVDGWQIDRADQERLATRAGMTPRSSVSRKTGLVVMSDLELRSAKAVKAVELGIPIVHEPDFWRALGYDVAVMERQIQEDEW